MTNKKKDLTKNALKEFFDMIRDENEGKITKEKLGSVAKELGYNLTDEELADMIEVADPAGDGAVSYKGLAKMVNESHQEFPRLKTSIEEIRRELTTLSMAEKADDKSTDNSNDNKDQDTNNNNTDEPTPSTSKIDNDEVAIEETRNSPTSPVTNKHNDKDFEAESVVIIGKVMKAQENDNRKINKDHKVNGTKTPVRPPLVVPVSEISEDGRSTAPNKSEQKFQYEDKNSSGLDKTNKDVVDKPSENIAIVPLPVVASRSTPRQAKTEESEIVTHSQAMQETVTNTPEKDIHEHPPTNDATDEVFAVEQVQEATPFNNNRRDVHSSQSVATRFSIDAGVVTAVDDYHVRHIRSRAKKKQETHAGEQDIDERDELDAVQETVDTEDGETVSQDSKVYIRDKTRRLDAVQEAQDTEDGETVSQDSKVYIRDKTRRVRRKASLTHSQDDAAPRKPVVRKRSLSKGRAVKAKGPVRPNDKHNVFYSGLGCALKISQLRMKQRLLYQMWQLVYDEAMTRVQQTFHYDYARDPAPLRKEAVVKPKKKVKKRSSSLDYDY